MLFRAVHHPVVLQNTRLPLAGDLVVPAGPGPFPAVAIVGGDSGPRDRGSWVNELCLAGLMAVTWDSPGWGDSPGPRRWQRPEQRVPEVLAAVDHLSRTADVPAGDVGLIASGTGTWTALMTAALSPRIRAVVLISPPLVDVAEQEIAALGRQLRADRFSPAEVQLAQTLLRQRIASLRAGVSPHDVLAGEAAAATSAWYAALQVRSTDELFAAAAVDGYDMLSLLRTVRCPVLAVLTERGDSDVSWRDALAVRRALDARDVTDHTVLVLPQQPAPYALPWEVTSSGPHMRPELSADIVDVLTCWLGARLHRRPLRLAD